MRGLLLIAHVYLGPAQTLSQTGAWGQPVPLPYLRDYRIQAGPVLG